MVTGLIFGYLFFVYADKPGLGTSTVFRSDATHKDDEVVLTPPDSNVLNRAGKDFALFFAQQDYAQHPEFGNLKHPVNEVRAIARELREMYGFSTTIYEDLTKTEISGVLKEWQGRAFPEDAQLLVFFSGHGAFDKFNSTGYFVPNGAGNRNEDYISLFELGRIVANIKCGHLLLSIDACYSGSIDEEIAYKGRPEALDGALTPQELVGLQLRHGSRLFITSGGLVRTPDRSAFAKSILDGLKRAYMEGDGLYLFSDLKSDLARVKPVPREGRLPGNKGGGFFFLSNPRSDDPAAKAR